MAFTTAAVVGLGSSVASGIMGVKAAKGAAGAQRAGAEQAGAILGQAGDEARGLSRQAADEFSGSLAALSPYSRLGEAGQAYLAKQLGQESLYAGRDPGPLGPEPGAVSTSARDEWARDLDRRNAILSQAGLSPGQINDPRVDPVFRKDYLQAQQGLAAEQSRIAAGSEARREWEAQRQRVQEYQAGRAQFEKDRADPEFGSAVRPFREFKFEEGDFRFGPEDFKADPGYEFRLGEGRRGLQQLYGSQGQLLSGNALKGLEDYGQDLASEEYEKVYGRALGEYEGRYQRALGEYQDAYNRDLELKLRKLGISTDLLGRGQQAATQRVQGAGTLASLRQQEPQIVQQTAANRAGIAQDIGNISAAERVAKSNAYADLFGSAAGAITAPLMYREIYGSRRR